MNESQNPVSFSWSLLEHDREIFQKELNAFVPDQVYDAHAHLYDKAHFTIGEMPPQLCPAPHRVDLQCFLDHIGWILPGRRVEGIFIPYPLAARRNTQEVNQFVSAEAQKSVRSRGEMIVTPQMNPEYVRQEARRLKASGLKCYHIFSRAKPSWNALINDYLPESFVSVAHQEKLFITLHLVRERSLADAENQRILRRYCKSYPDTRIILAHAGRGFNPYHTIEGIDAVKDLESLWFDTSAVTEAAALEAILRACGHRRLLWGSDFPISHFRGRCVGIGNGFVWLYEDQLRKFFDAGRIEPTLVGIESLRALRQAATNYKLTDSQIEDIFRNNALRMLDIC